MANKDLPSATDILTQGEMDKISAEVKFRKEEEDRISPRAPATLWSILDRPFMVTVIGGVFLALIGGGIQWASARVTSDRDNNIARETRRRDEAIAVRDKKYFVLKSAAEHIQTQEMLDVTIMDYVSWLHQYYKNKSVSQQVYEHRNASYESLQRRYFETPKAQADVLEIEAMFGTHVKDAAARLWEAVNDLDNLQPEDYWEFNSEHLHDAESVREKKIARHSHEMFRLMGDEISDDARRDIREEPSDVSPHSYAPPAPRGRG